MTESGDSKAVSAEVAEAVIFVHGTGAGIPDKVKPRWWQADSQFACKFLEGVGARYRLAEPFLWGNGGANSEVARRSGGEKLHERLATLDGTGTPYHLVGHSHGGSVIWHALVQSAQHGKKLENLKSWTTIGTPFLEFRPDPLAFWQVAGLASLVVALVLLWPSISTFVAERSTIFSEGDLLALGGLAFLGVVLAALLVFFLVRIGLLARQHFASQRETAAERQAAKWYGDQWLGLWHDRDEPISGLQATLSDAPHLVPRLAKPERGLFLRILLRPYDWLIAPIGDAFAWAAVMGKVQGSDELGRVMVSAGAAPPALAPGWPPLFESLADTLRGSADARAGASAGRLRDALATAAKQASGQAALMEIAKIIGWDELIHTSYFDAPVLGSIISARIAGRTVPADVPSAFARLATFDGSSRQHRHRSFRLAAMSALFAMGLTAVLAWSFYSTYRVIAEPLTSGAQLAVIGGVFDQRRIMGAADGRAAGSLIARLEAAGTLPAGKPDGRLKHDISRRIYSAVNAMPREEQRFAALQTVFFQLGARARENDLRDLFADLPAASNEDGNDKLEAVLAISAELGYLAVGKAAFADLLERANKILQVADPSGANAFSLVVSFLIRNGRLDQAAAVTERIVSSRPNTNCYRALFQPVVTWAGLGEGARAAAIVAQCKTDKDRLRLSLEAIAALARRGGNADIAMASELLRSLEGEFQLLTGETAGWHAPGIEKLLVSLGRIADAKTWILLCLRDAIDDARTGGYDSIPDYVAAAEEMARKGHRGDSQEIYAGLIEAGRYSRQPDLAAIKLKGGLTTKEEVRDEATAHFNSAQAGERSFRVAADAALAAMLFDLVDASKDVQAAVDVALPELSKLQPIEERSGTVKAIGGLAKHLDRDRIQRLADVASTIADQQDTIDHGDEILQVLAPHLARQKSLYAARRMAERIESIDRLLKAYAAIVDVHLMKTRPDRAANIVPDGKLPAIIAMNTELPKK